jgi:hypothetical protein
MPGPVSDSFTGPGEDAPYVPSWCYPNGPKVCPCGHHEGYHAGCGGPCLQAGSCGCTGLPAAAWTTDEDMVPHVIGVGALAPVQRVIYGLDLANGPEKPSGP